MANQLPTADESFGPAPLSIDETVPPEEEAERVTPRHEGAHLDLGRRFKCRLPDPTSGLFVDFTL